MLNARNAIFVAVFTCLAIATESNALGQAFRGNRQVGSPTRDSDSGFNARGMMRNQRSATALDNMNSGPRRTLFGNSASAAGNRPRNTTINPAATDPLTRNPAFLDPVSGVQVNGLAPTTSAFGTTGRSLINGGGPDDATALEQLLPAELANEAGPFAPDTLLSEPAAVDSSVINGNYNASNDSNSTDEAAFPIEAAGAVEGGAAGSGSSWKYTFPGADSNVTLPGAARKARRPAVVKKSSVNPTLFANRPLVAERLGLRFDNNAKTLMLTSVPTGTWAAHVGFLPGDRIVGIGGQSVRGYNDLAQYIVANPGARTSVEIQRRGKRESIPLDLASLHRDLALPDLSGEVTATGRPIGGTAAASLRAARMQTEPAIHDQAEPALPKLPPQ